MSENIRGLGKAYYHNSINKDLPVYRFFSFTYLLELIQNSELTISQVQNWDDVYENFLCKAEFDWGVGRPVSFMGHLPSFYGQCWTSIKESDALWRIYSPDKKGVKIKSSINRLLDASLNEACFEPFSTPMRIIGRVKYQTNKNLIKWVHTLDKYKIKPANIIDSLLMKRREFQHENEIRLIIQKAFKEEDFETGKIKSHLQLKVEPNNFIDEITFDPRLSDKDFYTYSNVLKSIGYKNKISKSALYSFEKIRL